MEISITCAPPAGNNSLFRKQKNVNNSLQVRNRIFVRNITRFSEKQETHDTLIAIIIHQ
ncbi:MAG: hypothetical protein LC115_10025 [Bacteroidia bacterium]|nr:hypothetical protein [Bacteroidia bacterium]